VCQALPADSPGSAQEATRDRSGLLPGNVASSEPIFQGSAHSDMPARYTSIKGICIILGLFLLGIGGTVVMDSYNADISWTSTSYIRGAGAAVGSTARSSRGACCTITASFRHGLWRSPRWSAWCWSGRGGFPEHTHARASRWCWLLP